MKKFLVLYLLTFLSFGLYAQIDNDIPNRPLPQKLVNDFTNTLSTEQIANLESRLVKYDDTTSNQIAIVIVDNLKGHPVEDYALALGRKWGVGNKSFDNGIVILVSTGGGDGNRDLHIAVGYGLESVIPDITAKQIIDYEMIPLFKAGDIFSGLQAGISSIVKAAEGKYEAPDGWADRGKASGGGKIIIIIFIILILFFLFSGDDKGGGYVSRRGYSPWVGGGSWPTRGSGGGGWSGGGGGFGGFGGGSFGGGGASGKW